MLILIILFLICYVQYFKVVKISLIQYKINKYFILISFQYFKYFKGFILVKEVDPYLINRKKYIK